MNQLYILTTQGSRNLQSYVRQNGEVLKDENGNSLYLKNINLHFD